MMSSDRVRMRLDTKAGEVTMVRGALADFEQLIALLREAADWLSSRGNPQWEVWHMEAGERILRDRLESQEVYLARRDASLIGTVTLQWSDSEVWGERGIDGKAGYVHGIAIRRSVGGMGVGDRLLEWAVDRIRERGRPLARLDAMASNQTLCRYYEERGFRPLGTVMLAGNFVSRLFERKV